MPYTTIQDLENAAGGAARFVQITDWDGDGFPDADAIAAAQARADGLVDSYAAKRYAVPVREPSAALVQVAADETIFQLLVRRGQASDIDREERDIRIAWLDALSEGKVRPSDPAPRRSSAVADRYRSSERAVSRGQMKGFW